MEIITQIISNLGQGSVLIFLRDAFAAYMMLLGGLKIISRLTPWNGDDIAVELLGKPVDFLKSILGNPENKDQK